MAKVGRLGQGASSLEVRRAAPGAHSTPPHQTVISGSEKEDKKQYYALIPLNDKALSVPDFPWLAVAITDRQVAGQSDGTGETQDESG